MSNTYDITGTKRIKQGSDKNIIVVIKSDGENPDNLTGYTARMQIRQSIKSDTILDELTTENDRIEITPLEGKLTIKFPNIVTSNYDFTKGVYDLEIVTGTPEVVSRILQGDVEVDLEVTR